MADLFNRVVEQTGRYFNQLVLNKDHTTHLSIRNLEHCTRSELTNVSIGVGEARK